MVHGKRRARGLGLLAILALAGCGGSSSSETLKDSGTTASVSAGQGAETFVAVQSLSGLATLSTARVTRDPQYSESLGLYYTVTTLSSTSVRVDFSTNADGSGSTAGKMTLTLTMTSPARVHESYDVTSNGTHVKGETDVVLSDDGTAVSATGTVITEHPDTQGQFALAYNESTVTGSFTYTAHGQTVTFTNIVATPDGAFAADYGAHGLSGHVTRAADGSGSVTSETAQGNIVLTWTTDKTATIHLPNGTTKELGTLSGL